MEADAGGGWILRSRLINGTAVTSLVVVLALFATILAGEQSDSQRELEESFAERTQISAALIDSVFEASSATTTAEDARRYGGSVTTDTMKRTATEGNLNFAVLFGERGELIASTPGVPDNTLERVGRGSAVLRGVLGDNPYQLGDVIPAAGQAPASIPFARTITVASGKRYLVTGIAPELLFSFLSGVLVRVPNEDGGGAFAVDSDGALVGAADESAEAGRPLNSPGLLDAMQGGTSGTYNDDDYFASSPVGRSTWRVALTAPKDRLFASVRGAAKWIPWAIFLAFAIAGIAVVLLLRRTLAGAAEISHANARLEQANVSLDIRARALARSNEELEQFASIASHDLQEPLRKVQTFADLLEAEEADGLSEKGIDYLRRSNAAAKRMQQLIQDLLAFSRVSTHVHPFEQVDLAAVSREVIADLDTAIAEAGGEIQVGPLPTISADATQMRQLIQNLLANALKYRREGVAPVVKLNGSIDTGIATITVSDNGIGFEPRYAARIFRVFERLHGREEYQGTGIGLAICRKIAERHEGTILAEGRPGEGATFTVKLPANPPDPPDPPEGPRE